MPAIEPNTIYDQENEWDVYPKDTTDGIGLHVSTLATTNVSWKELSIFPNPTSVNFLNIKINQDIKIEVFSIFGKKFLRSLFRAYFLFKNYCVFICLLF